MVIKIREKTQRSAQKGGEARSPPPIDRLISSPPTKLRDNLIASICLFVCMYVCNR